LNEQLLNSKVVIVGTVRDCFKFLEQDILKLAKAFALFKDLHWFIVESDSSDRTVDCLASLQALVPNFHFKSLGQLATGMPLRTERIAFCRNACLDEVRTNPLFVGADLMVVADLDNSQSQLTQEGVMSSFERDDWGAVTSNQNGLYYDIWALRHPVWNPGDCWQQKFFLEGMKLSKDVATYSAVFSRMIAVPHDAEWIEVESSFGGLGIYKTEFLNHARYEGHCVTGPWGGQVCEHVAFSAALRANGAKIFINPTMVNTSLNEHSFLAVIPDEMNLLIEIAQQGGEKTVDENGQLKVMTVTPEDVIGAYKIFLSRQPESMAVVQPRVGMSTDMVLIDFLTSTEFLSRKGVENLIKIAYKKYTSLG
jgi:hypothetical protein